jgi:alpha-glucosidase (family GH31 glycosyl hydrolase)
MRFFLHFAQCRMYGRDYLVAPVLNYQQASRSVYLPRVTGATWVYFWNGTDAGQGGARVTVDTTSMSDFGLFLRTPA